MITVLACVFEKTAPVETPVVSSLNRMRLAEAGAIYIAKTKHLHTAERHRPTPRAILLAARARLSSLPG
jgi:hypothetical protein